MESQFWCIAPSHPLVRQVSEKYNVSIDDAKTILNTARGEDPNIQDDNLPLSFIEEQQSFKDALETFVGKQVETVDILFKEAPGEKQAINEVRDLVAKDLGRSYSVEEVEDMMNNFDDIFAHVKKAHVNAEKISRILTTFRDTRRLEFVGNWICKYISELLTVIETDSNLRSEYGIPTRKTRADYLKDDDTKLTIFNIVRGELEDRADALRQEGKDQLASELSLSQNAKYFPILLYLYGGRLFRDEQLSIDPEGLSKIFELEDDSPQKNDSDENNDDDNEDISENPTSVFSASDQNKSITSKIVPSIKTLLSNIRDIDSKGNAKEDGFGYGMHTYVDVPKAVNKLLKTCQGCQTYNEMVQSISQARKATPWFNTLLTALDTTTKADVTGFVDSSKSKKEQLQTMFFQSFRKQFTQSRLSFMTHDENGDIVFVNRGANTRHRTESMINSAKTKISNFSGSPMFNNGKFDFSYFKNNVYKLGSSGVEKEMSLAKAEVNNNNNVKEGIRHLSLAESQLLDIINEFGIPAKRELLDEYLSNGYDTVPGKYESEPEKKEFFNRVNRLDKLRKKVIALNNTFREWGDAQKTKKTTDTTTTNPLIRKKGNSDWEGRRKFYEQYELIADAISEYSPDSFESRYHINGKDYYSWNNPSSILTMVESLTKQDKGSVQDYITKKYGKDAVWFMKPSSKDGKPHFYSDWLEDIYHNQGREMLEYSEKPSFCGEEYNGMSDVSYALSILSDYFFPERHKKDTAWYRMLIASDKPRYSSVKFKRYSDRSVDKYGEYTENNYHTVIAHKAEDFFAQELRRCIDVVDFASKGRGVKMDVYDINIDKDNKRVFDKIKKGETVTVDDVLKDGRYIFRGSGASFFINKFINEEIENKSQLGRFVVDRIFNYKKHKNEELIPPEMLQIFRDGEIIDGDGNTKGGFHEYIKNISYDFFDHLREIGALASRTRHDEEEGDSQHLLYFAGNMNKWHEDEEGFTGIMYSRTDRAEGLAKFFGEEKPIANTEKRPLYCEMVQLLDDIEEFAYNNWLAKANMSEIFDVDLAFYGTTPNFQKRNAQVVSAGYATDPDASIHGDKVSDGYYRSITLKTEDTESSHLENIRVLLEKRMDQITDPDQKKQFKAGMDYTLKKLSGFDSTDGQALTSLTGLRKRLAGQGEWSRSSDPSIDRVGYVEYNGKREYIFTDEAVYWRMKRGYKSEEDKAAKTYDLMHMFAQIQKPFAYSFVNIDRPGRGKITVPVQHKNSEYALVSLTYFLASEKPNSKMAAIAKFLEESAENDIVRDDDGKVIRVKPGHGIDTVNFDSGVKIGGNNKTIDLSNMSGQEAYEALNKAVYGPTKSVDNNGNNIYKQGVVTEYDNTDYKIVQQKNEHFKKGYQPIGSQIKVLSINNIDDNIPIKLKDGTEITGKELKRRYFSALRKKMQSTEYQFRKEFGLNMPRRGRLHKLSNTLKEAMSTDQKFTVDMRRALSITQRNGVDQFVVPLDEVSQQGAVEAMLHSKTRKVYYKEKTRGGIVVQATSWGGSDDYHIRFFSSNPEDKDGLVPTFEEFAASHNYGKDTKKKYNEYLKAYQTGYAWFECEIPMPDHVRKMIANKDGSIDEKYFNRDGSWNMKAIREAVPDSCFDAICYRVPTEAKYSMMVCKVKQFCPEYTSVAKYPQELTEFTDADFDIDTDFIEIRPESGARDYAVDNELFDYHMAALQSMGSVQETFKPGDFSDLSELSYKVVLMEKEHMTEEELDKLPFKTLKKMCEAAEDLDLMDPFTDVLLRKQNMDAKDMIAIAAVGVTSHAFISLYNDVDVNNPKRNPKETPENFTRVHFAEGKNGSIDHTFRVINKEGKVAEFSNDCFLDMMYDMDGKLISTEISKYVGASADAAKDAAEYRLNITQRTLPILILMHRLGVSSDVARLFITQQPIRDMMDAFEAGNALQGTMSMDYAVEKAIDRIRERHKDKEGNILSEKEAATIWNDVTHRQLTLNYKDLVDAKIHPEHTSAEFEMSLLHIFQSLSDVARGVRNLDSFTRYNSSNAMRGSAFLDRFVASKRIEKLQRNLNRGETATIKLPQDVPIADEFEKSEYGRLCSMFPYIANTIIGEQDMIENILVDNMHTYNSTFFYIANRLFDNNFEDKAKVAALKDLYTGWKNYLLFASDLRIADFTDKAVAKYYTTQFADSFYKRLEGLKDSHKFDDVLTDNSFIDSIHRDHSPDGYADFDMLKTDMSGLRDTALEKYKRDWEALLKYPETKKLAIDTTIHFLARAAAFNRNTPIHVMPLAIKEAIPHYIDAFENADKISMDWNEINSFIAMFQRNNPDNKTIVPHFYYNPKTDNFSFAPKSEGSEGGILTIKKNAKGFANWLEGNSEGDIALRVPVISIDGALFLVANENPLIQDKVDGEDVYKIEAQFVSSLGIPNQIVEYVGYDSSESLFDAPEVQEGEDTDNKNQTEIPLEPPVIEGDVLFGDLDDQNILMEGQRVGSFIENTPYGYDSSTDVEYDKALAPDTIGGDNNPFLESRTYIRRADRIAKAMGFKISTVNRASIGGPEAGNAQYLLTLSAKEYNPDNHEAAVELASVVSSLASQKPGYTLTTTYTQDMSKANGIEFVMPVSLENRSQITSLFEDFGCNYTLNNDNGELHVQFEFDLEEAASGQIEKIQTAISDIAAIFNKLKSLNLTDAEGVEYNFIKSTFNTPKENKEVLNKIKNKNNETGERTTDEETPENAGEISKPSVGEKVGINYLADLALRKIDGEKVNEEIREVFDEYRRSLKDTNTSYQSTTLSQSVFDSMDEDIYTEIANLIADKPTGKRTDSEVLNDVIVNVANWILGHRSEEDITTSLEMSGLTTESAEGIISIIKNNLEELDIC